ncbi:hypothetical protein H0H92_012729, partial [Tricholoma furcatifolium]
DLSTFFDDGSLPKDGLVMDIKVESGGGCGVGKGGKSVMDGGEADGTEARGIVKQGDERVVASLRDVGTAWPERSLASCRMYPLIVIAW